MTDDRDLLQAFLVADEILRATAPPDFRVFGLNARCDERIPPGVVAIGSANGCIVVSRT